MALFDVLVPRIPQLGCIKIGKKSDKPNTSKAGRIWYAPEKIDHFLLTTMHRDSKEQLIIDAELMSQLKHDGYADPDGKLRRIPIMVLSNDPEDVMQSAYCWYPNRKIGARSDGKTLTWFVGHDKDDWGKPLQESVTEDWKPEYADALIPPGRYGEGNKIFKQHTIFNCVIASASSRFGGVYKFRTTSQITGSQLSGGLLHILELTNGILTGIPLQLVVRPLPVSPVVNGRQVNSTIHIVHVEFVGKDLQAIQDKAMKQAQWALQSASNVRHALLEYKKLLRAPGMEANQAEIAEISEEFHPESFGDRPPVQMPRATDEPAPEANGQHPDDEPSQEVPETPPVIDGPVPTKEEQAEIELNAIKKYEFGRLTEIADIMPLTERADRMNALFVAMCKICPAKHKNEVKKMYAEFGDLHKIVWDKSVKAFVARAEPSREEAMA